MNSYLYENFTDQTYELFRKTPEAEVLFNFEEYLKSTKIKCEKYINLMEEVNELRNNIGRNGRKIQNYANNAAAFNNIKQDKIRERFNLIANDVNQIVPEDQRITTIRYKISPILLIIF